MGSANWGAFRGSPNHAANWMAPCFSVPSSEAGGHTQYQPKSGIFKSAVLDHFHIGADSQPAYLICTDPDLPLEELVKSYLWRWDIEVNHRDEKTLLGVGEAQVRHPESVWSVPASAVASYAMLHLAAIEAYGWAGKPNVIPQPKWRKPKKKKRASTLDLINELRREFWAEAIHQNHLTDFMNKSSPDTKSCKCHPNLASCLFTGTR
jgi:hypothetical protein